MMRLVKRQHVEKQARASAATCLNASAIAALEMYHDKGNVVATSTAENVIFALKSLGISKAFVRQSLCPYAILKHLQVLATIG